MEWGFFKRSKVSKKNKVKAAELNVEGIAFEAVGDYVSALIKFKEASLVDPENEDYGRSYELLKQKIAQAHIPLSRIEKLYSDKDFI